jgi:hypothetical protein
MITLMRTDTAASFARAPHLDGRILARARRRQGRASRLTAPPLAARPLTAPSTPARFYSHANEELRSFDKV